MLRIEFEQNLAANEQTGPINKEMRNLVRNQLETSEKQFNFKQSIRSNLFRPPNARIATIFIMLCSHSKEELSALRLEQVLVQITFTLIYVYQMNQFPDIFTANAQHAAEGRGRTLQAKVQGIERRNI
jgi:hypothetical protein